MPDFGNRRLSNSIPFTRDKACEFFGVDRVRGIVRELQERPAQAILDRLFEAALAWGEARPWKTTPRSWS